jgi:hypothetical protein
LALVEGAQEPLALCVPSLEHLSTSTSTSMIVTTLSLPSLPPCMAIRPYTVGVVEPSWDSWSAGQTTSLEWKD